MEAIRNYLESMFQALPNTPEVQKAKRELWQMMEDKYTELKNEGISENEAVGTVISEFGNLDELAFDLGIDGYMKPENNVAGRQVGMDEIRGYLQDKIRSGYLIGFGVLLCICSPCGVILTDSIGIFDFIGLIFMFVAIAIAVALFIIARGIMGQWDYLIKEPCSIDFATTEYVHDQRENYRMTSALLIAVGVLCCIISVIPVIVMDELGLDGIFEATGVVILLVLVAIGVYFFVASGTRSAAYETVLKINSSGTMGASFVPSQNKIRYTNKSVAAVMSVYWPTVTCIYLCWSFLSADWHITWIIWVIASLIETFIKNAFRE